MRILAVITAALMLSAAPALAQTPKLNAQTSKISEIIKVPAAKAALEKALPEITAYFDQIGEMSLGEVAPMSQGTITEEKMKALQVEFDKIK